MSIILFRYQQFASKIYNAISMYYFLCKLITDLQNSIHFITGLNHMHRSSVRQKKSYVRFRFGKNSLFGRILVQTKISAANKHNIGIIMSLNFLTVHSSFSPRSTNIYTKFLLIIRIFYTVENQNHTSLSNILAFHS